MEIRKLIFYGTHLNFIYTHTHTSFYFVKGAAVYIHLLRDKEPRCSDTDDSARSRFRQSGSTRGRWASGCPLRVFPQTTCGPAEVTGRTCLLVERLAERETERGGTWGRAVGKRNGNPSFYTWPVFLCLFVFVYLILFILLIGHGILTLCVFCWISNSIADTETSFVLD